MNKTTTKAMEKRVQRVQKGNEKRIRESMERLENAISDVENIVNVKAKETMDAYKNKGINSVEFVEVSQQLCTILVQSKLKRLYNKEQTSREIHRQTKIELSAYMSEHGTKIDTLISELGKLYVIRYNEDGDKETICTDKERERLIMQRIASLSNNHGYDYVMDAYIVLLDYLNRMPADKAESDYLLKPFKTPVLHSKVYKNGDTKSENLWQYTMTNVLKEMSKAISRSIESERSIQDTQKAYELVEVELDGESIRKYHEVNAISLGEIRDYNGKITSIVNNENIEELASSIPEKCNLTKRETMVLKRHYYKNESFEQIADNLGVEVGSIKKIDQRLKDKIVKSKMFAEYGLEERVKQNNESKLIAVYTKDDALISLFESIGQINKVLNISKGCISECLKGKRKTAGGYIFKYV